MSDASLHAVILAGGRGTRFWPRSRAGRPKQFLPITSERTMLQATVDRLENLVAPENVWVITGEDTIALAREQLPQIPAERVVAEPVGRNTAPAVALAARLVEREDPEATMIVLPADHHVGNVARFKDVLRRSIEGARSSAGLVTIGVEPEGPETGYGYLQVADGAAGGDALAKVARFVEKPDRANAEAFVRDGGYLWNAGMFAWTVAAITAATVRYLPEIDEAVRTIVAAWGDDRVFRSTYERMDGTSVDYGILEKSENVFVVSGRFGWDDIGSWTALGRLLPKDADGNVSRGDVVAVDARDNITVADGRIIALVGVDDLVVVDTRDALLVTTRSRVQEVRDVVEALERSGRKDVL